MSKTPDWFTDPATGRGASAPWCRKEARRRKMPHYRSDTPCTTCNHEPCYRYVRSDSCVWCMSLDLTSFAKGEPLRVMTVYPEDKLITLAPRWSRHADIPDEEWEKSTRELLEAGYTQEGVDEVHLQRGWHEIYIPPTVTGHPCVWGPHIRHLDADGNCSSCEREAPTARQQFESGLGEGLTRDEAIAKNLQLYPGRPCPNGHSAWRFVTSDRCWECFDTAGGVKQLQYGAAEQFEADKRITLEEAQKADAKLFFGNPCGKGHSGWRRVKGRACYECSIGVSPRPPKDWTPEMAKAMGYDSYWGGEDKSWVPL